MVLDFGRGLHRGRAQLWFASPHRPSQKSYREPPVTVEDVEQSEYKESWPSAMRAEAEGHKSAGTFASDESPRGENAVAANWFLSWKADAIGLITKAKARLVARDTFHDAPPQ